MRFINESNGCIGSNNIHSVIIDRVGVLPPHRNLGIGKKSVYNILIHLLKLKQTIESIKFIFLVIPGIPMNSFIENKLISFGFERCDNSIFEQVNINSNWGTIHLISYMYRIDEEDHSLHKIIELMNIK